MTCDGAQLAYLRRIESIMSLAPLFVGILPINRLLALSLQLLVCLISMGINIRAINAVDSLGENRTIGNAGITWVLLCDGFLSLGVPVTAGGIAVFHGNFGNNIDFVINAAYSVSLLPAVFAQVILLFYFLLSGSVIRMWASKFWSLIFLWDLASLIGNAAAFLFLYKGLVPYKTSIEPVVTNQLIIGIFTIGWFGSAVLVMLIRHTQWLAMKDSIKATAFRKMWWGSTR